MILLFQFSCSMWGQKVLFSELDKYFLPNISFLFNNIDIETLYKL